MSWAGPLRRDARAAVVSGSKLEDAKHRVALVAPLRSGKCPLPFGARSLQQSFLNRHDFARMHSFDFHLFPISRQAAAEGTWYRFQALKEVRPCQFPRINRRAD